MIRVWTGGGVASAARRLPRPEGRSPWTRGVGLVLACASLTVGATGALGVTAMGAAYGVYIDRARLPDLEAFTHFEFPTIGRIYDANGEPLIEFAREYRQLTPYDEIPPIVRQAILATEDRRFFSHDGVDYRSLARVLGKVRLGALVGRLATGGRHDNTAGPAIFPQGGSTITQQLVRGVFLQRETAQENSYQLRTAGLGAAVLSTLVGARNANMALRKREETRLALWIEQEMRVRFGSKRRAKEEIFARYASYVYMGKGQYGFASAAQYYLGRPLADLSAADAASAALLAGIMKSPRDYAPTAEASAPVLRRRNQILGLMAAQGFLTEPELTAAKARPLPAVVPPALAVVQSSAAVEHVLDELAADGLGVDELLLGQVQVYATVDARVQRIAGAALERGLARYEQRHPAAQGLVQGSVVVLKNGDGSVLAEVGGRQLYAGRGPSYRDFNRVRQSQRQPGSTMKPIVYLAAFRRGDFTLETLVPDEPISVPNGDARPAKWISNYDGRFKGPIRVREALAESRNAVAVWITAQIGIDAVLRAARSLGIETPLQPYVTTALGASEVTLLELATAYRTIASGVVASPYVIRRVVLGTNAEGTDRERLPPVHLTDVALVRIQEGLRGVIRLPTGTAHALDARAFPIAVMGKTGTTNEFRDALFVGSTFGVGGITVAVRIGFDDNRSLGARETGGRVALPVFREVMSQAYGEGLVGPVPVFPSAMEQRITRSILPETAPPPASPTPSPADLAAATRLSTSPEPDAGRRRVRPSGW